MKSDDANRRECRDVFSAYLNKKRRNFMYVVFTYFTCLVIFKVLFVLVYHVRFFLRMLSYVGSIQYINKGISSVNIFRALQCLTNCRLPSTLFENAIFSCYSA